MQIYIRKYSNQQKDDLEEVKATDQVALEESHRYKRGYDYKEGESEYIRNQAQA